MTGENREVGAGEASRTREELRAHEERQRVKAEMDQKRDLLVQMLVHDLRSPLTALCINLKLLRVYSLPVLPDDARPLLADALQLAGDITEMVNDMLDVSRFEQGIMPLEIAEVELVDVVSDGIAAVPSDHGVEVRMEGEHRVPVACDPFVIKRVVTNLVSNAVRATPRGGVVTVRVSADRVVTVRDRGEGIPAELHSLMFDKFWNAPSGDLARPRGTGLGLAFCRLAVQAHGGAMDVQSRPGEGAAFAFSLPRIAQVASDAS